MGSEEPRPAPSAALTAALAAATPATPVAALVAAHYPELRALAARIASNERPGASLNPTALVHEAFLRLVDQSRITDRGSTFFRACFGQECRRVLVDQARARHAARRGGDRDRVTMVEFAELHDAGGIDLLLLHEAIEALARRNERMARIVDLRIFGGLTIAECALALGVAPRTVDKDWLFARSWLQRELRR